MCCGIGSPYEQEPTQTPWALRRVHIPAGRLQLPQKMSSRFVSGGTTDTKTGEIVPTDPSTSTSAAPTTGGKRSEEWAAVQAQIEEDRKRRQQQREEAAAPGGEKSLYEVLQANKAAKQAAFEEASKLKNQFRALDDDEVEFLDGVRERRRAEEERLRRETEEGLKGFRELQSKVSAAGEREGPEGEGAGEGGGGWSVGRKRKRRKDENEGVLKGLKRRSSAAAADDKADEKGGESAAVEATAERDSAAAAKDAIDAQKSQAKPAPPVAPKPKVSLVDYGSDDDSD